MNSDRLHVTSSLPSCLTVEIRYDPFIHVGPGNGVIISTSVINSVHDCRTLSIYNTIN